MSFLAKMVVRRGTVTLIFESDDLEELETAEKWVYDISRRMAAMDEQAAFEAAAPGDTVRLRTR